MTTYIAPIGDGLGDLIVCLPTIQALVASGEPTVLVLRSPRQQGCEQLIPGLQGYIREVDLDATILGGGCRYVNLREHPLQTDHVWGSVEFERAYPGYKMADIVRDISRDFGIDADFENLKPLPFQLQVQLRSTVLLVPGSGGTFKCWFKDGWLEISRRLQEKGLSTALIGEPDKSPQVKELIEAGIPWLATPSLPAALNALSSAAAMVSVDTGLMHLSLQQLTPTAAIWINNPGSLNYARTVKHCFPVISPRCAPQCVGEELDKALNLVTQFSDWKGYDSWTCHAPEASRCMNNVTVDAVWQQTQRALTCDSHAGRLEETDDHSSEKLAPASIDRC